VWGARVPRLRESSVGLGSGGAGDLSEMGSGPHGGAATGRVTFARRPPTGKESP
jgi:hypothetical protein